ncbi:MAG: two-component system response regulator GlrR [Betaproteobacteria bacterium RIFCSPLOWO2_12_FULL_67_28]|nr:MAG: two-component system response regulator GlrR [Betaproteobacteria bacterium RIFCSPLOWO2_02_FULL_68_150]OGA68886.1 MAG: two-component system response regulator GlrR [Betaproteobacteria bacterium RIFCSPLOWO2_12_FULL_67_28]
MSPYRPRVLVVDDDADLLQLIAMRLSAAGYDVARVASGEQALAQLAVSRPQVVVTDLRMEGMDGMALFDAIHRESPTLPVVILTAHGTIPEAVTATRRGVFSFLTKPFDGKVLLATVAEALRLSSMPAGDAEDWRAEILTRSAAMEAVLAQARRVADSEASVCIRGPSGAGKELLARAIHRASRRAGAPFIAVNCSAIPEGLLESELFGHRKGAFTGAVADRQGLFQAAHGGTLFLDEIGDMPMALQVKLLRALEERVIRPVGASDTAPVNVRIITATHRDLEARIAAGEFREDFYYRLSVVKLEVPPLAARSEDIPLLAGTFLTRAAERYVRPNLVFSPEAMELLISAAWPGNVRQLLNVVERSVVLSSTEIIPASIVRESLDSGAAVLTPLDEARRAFERHYLVRILKATNGNVSRAARLAGRNRTEFYRLLERHALEPAMFKSSASSDTHTA